MVVILSSSSFYGPRLCSICLKNNSYAQKQQRKFLKKTCFITCFFIDCVQWEPLNAFLAGWRRRRCFCRQVHEEAGLRNLCGHSDLLKRKEITHNRDKSLYTTCQTFWELLARFEESFRFTPNSSS